MKIVLLVICGMLLFLGTSHADLITIGTATYASATSTATNTSQSTTENVYNLIWDDGFTNDIKTHDSIVWMDYSNSQTWVNLKNWAGNLESALDINLDSGYHVNWNDSTWRLPITDVNLLYQWGYDGTTTAGYNITASEMGHLYYEELGLIGKYNTNGIERYSGWGLTNTGLFENLVSTWYWSETEDLNYPNTAWGFDLSRGLQGNISMGGWHSGLAVRAGNISFTPVPEPTTIIIFGLGLLGLARVNRKKQ